MDDYSKVISYCDDLYAVLKDKKDLNSFAKCLEHMKALRSSCDADLADINTALQVIATDIANFERARVSIQERKRATKKLEQDELSVQNTLSMLASVTDIIPDLSDPSNISGHIIDRDEKAVRKFEFDSTRTTEFDACNNIWKMIGP